MIKGVTHDHAHLGPICYHSEPSDVPIPKTSQDQFLGLDFSYRKTTLVMVVFLCIDYNNT